MASGGTRENSHGAEPFTGSASRLRFVMGRILFLHSGWICEAGFRLASHGSGDIPLDAGPVRSSCMHACSVMGWCQVTVPTSAAIHRRIFPSLSAVAVAVAGQHIPAISCKANKVGPATYNGRMILSRKQSVRRGPTKAGFGLSTPSPAAHSACSTPNYELEAATAAVAVGTTISVTKRRGLEVGLADAGARA